MECGWRQRFQRFLSNEMWINAGIKDFFNYKYTNIYDKKHGNLVEVKDLT